MGQPAFMPQGYAYGGAFGNIFAGTGDQSQKMFSGHYSSGQNASDVWLSNVQASVYEYLERMVEAIEAETDPEKKRALQMKFANEFNAIQSSYANLRRSNAAYGNPTGYFTEDDAVRQHQEMFNGDAYKGNAHMRPSSYVRSERTMNTEDVPDTWADGLWGPATNLRHFGSSEIDFGDGFALQQMQELANRAGMDYGQMLGDEYALGNDQYMYGLTLRDDPAAMKADVANTAGTAGAPQLEASPEMQKAIEEDAKKIAADTQKVTEKQIKDSEV